jgi:hypothetical protein
VAVATEHHTTVAPLDVQWVSLADVLRHVITLKRVPEADIRSEIIEAIASGKLPHFVERTTKYLPRPFATHAVAPFPTDAPKEQPLKIEVRYNEPMPPEVLERGKVGRGSLYIDWQKSRATRRAGLTWSHIEFEGIWCSREHMLALWPNQIAEPSAPKNHDDATSVILADAPAAKKHSRKKGRRAGFQTLRAGKVLRKRYPESYPSEEEVSNADLLSQFQADYDEMLRTRELTPTRHPAPSRSTILRIVGRK